MLKVRDVMARSVVTVDPTTPLKDVAGSLVDNRISGVPVVDSLGTVLGVVSEADLLVKEQGAEAIRHRRLVRFFGDSSESRAQLAKLAAVTAGEAMTAPAVTLGSARPISEAAALMTARKINRLPVVDGGRLVGIVTRADLVRAYRALRRRAGRHHPRRSPAPHPVARPDVVQGRGQRRRGIDQRACPAEVDGRDDRADREHGAGHHRCPSR